ncbi:DUF4342 domain-containing protein [Acidipropionibacterium virtanenii]|uniref:DUF4342 domain-containing protein n=1 Tax=Acidipropionibacterium virtanenii TaxID=2057246 RepID=A0A344UWY7_9ACTN|nr:DUF4342 domain-containing protein [Acidipropionibacterium virtanenii]AXE39785.1 hypothetical protein JS278_02648 [Acidipropionibacterium virtanenii]
MWNDFGKSGSGPRRSNTEHFEVPANQLLSKVKSLVSQGNVRRIVIRRRDGRRLFSVPLSAGVAVGGVTVLAAPTIAAIGAIAALGTGVTVEVERREDH